MFFKFLRLLKTRELLNQEQIALELGVSQTLVVSMVDELDKLGYLESGLAMTCEQGAGACRQCGSLKSCGVGIRNLNTWFLTEKGVRAVIEWESRENNTPAVP
jgi:hypothetical protein